MTHSFKITNSIIMTINLMSLSLITHTAFDGTQHNDNTQHITPNIMSLCIETLSLITHILTTASVMTLSITKSATLNIKISILSFQLCVAIQTAKLSFVMLDVVMLDVVCWMSLCWMFWCQGHSKLV
jgi:hypothetical protein